MAFDAIEYLQYHAIDPCNLFIGCLLSEYLSKHISGDAKKGRNMKRFVETRSAFSRSPPNRVVASFNFETASLNHELVEEGENDIRLHSVDGTERGMEILQVSMAAEKKSKYNQEEEDNIGEEQDFFFQQGEGKLRSRFADLQRRVLRWDALQSNPEQIEKEIAAYVNQLACIHHVRAGLVAVDLQAIPEPYRFVFFFF